MTDPMLPWLDPSLPASERASLLLARMSRAEKAALASSDPEAVAHFGVPALTFADGPNGVRDGRDATAFPSAMCLGATFDTSLAEEFGAAVGSELRWDGRNTWLGPSVDIARSPLAGRLGEALSEDPVVVGRLAAAQVRGARRAGIAVMPKHVVANNFETGRTGIALEGGRGPAVNTVVDEGTLRELYLAPVRDVVDAGAGLLMASYNRLNGEYPSQSPHLWDIVKGEWGWPGAVAPDYLFAVRDLARAVASGLDIPGLDGAAGRTPEMLLGGMVPAERLDDICYRILWATFDAGVADGAASTRPAGSPNHRELARRIACDGAVLLANRGVLPLAPGLRSIAVIGEESARLVLAGSGSVALPTALERASDAIRRRAGAGVTVAAVDGVTPEAVRPAIPPERWLPAAGDALRQGAGDPVNVIAEFWPSVSRAGSPAISSAEPTIDLHGVRDGMPDAFSARWRGRVSIERSGMHEFAISVAGTARLKVNGVIVAEGNREAVAFLGPACPVTGTIELTAGTGADIVLEYATGAVIVVPELGLNGPECVLGWQEPDDRVAAAAAAAASSDVAVVVVGFAASEGMDRSGLRLPGLQEHLIASVAAANPRTVVVLTGSGPVAMPWADSVAAILEMWNPGQEFPAALAGLLFGDDDPGGRLPVTFPLEDTALPSAPGCLIDGSPDDVVYTEGVRVGYRATGHAAGRTRFPFGHGSSYGRATIAAVAWRVTTDGLIAECDVHNESDRVGMQLLQLYVSHPIEDGRALVSLCDFRKVRLGTGRSETAVLRLPPSRLSRFDLQTSSWRVRPGRYTVAVGTSVADVQSGVSLDVTSDGGMRLVE